jgi:hypothetical protein
MWPTPKGTDADRGRRGDLIQAVRGNQSPSGHFRSPSEVSSPASEVSTSGSGEPVCALCGSASRTCSVGGSLLGTGPESRAIPTCAPLWPTPTAATGGDGQRADGYRRLLGPQVMRVEAGECPCQCHQLTSSQAVSLARTSRWPAAGPDWPENARVFGGSSQGSFASFSPATWSSRTSQDYSDMETSRTPSTDAYAAGLIDGEGCISIDKKHTIRIDVGMSAKALPALHWLEAHYEGRVRQTREATEKWEAAFCWTLIGRKVEDVLRRIRPHLLLKGDQAGIALEMQALRRSMPTTPGGRMRWTEDGRAAAERLRLLMREANRKGPEHSPTLAGDRIALLVGERWVGLQMDLFDEAGLTSYLGTWPRSGSLPASAFGAPHRRDRIWLVAYPNGQGEPGEPVDARPGRRELVPRRGVPDAEGERRGEGRTWGPAPGGAREPVAVGALQDADLADADGSTGNGTRPAGEALPRPSEVERPGRRGSGIGNPWLTEPDVGRVAHGIPARVDRLRALGNSLVPQIAEWIGRRILAWEDTCRR